MDAMKIKEIQEEEEKEKCERNDIWIESYCLSKKNLCLMYISGYFEFLFKISPIAKKGKILFFIFLVESLNLFESRNSSLIQPVSLLNQNNSN